MGMFSYLCKECNHPLLSKGATNPGINDWMSRAVVLTNRGEVFIGEYDGYGRAGGEDSLDYHACLHEACWEKAGKPLFAHYGSPSDGAPDQGWFFDDGEHDLIDPRITEGREELLRVGVEARTKARYDQKARDLREMLTPSRFEQKTPCQKRFSLMGDYKEGKKLENQWIVCDKLDLLSGDERHVSGTEAEVWAGLEVRFNAFLESDAGKALLARGIEMRDESRRAYFEQVKTLGRFETHYKSSRGPGTNPRFYVEDKMTFKTVAEYEYSGSGEMKACNAVAAQDAAKRNAAWAAEGYPWTWMEEE